MRVVSRIRYGGHSGFTCLKKPGMRTAIGSTGRIRTSTSYSRAIATRRLVARYE
jgi:hypothetical protein